MNSLREWFHSEFSQKFILMIISQLRVSELAFQLEINLQPDPNKQVQEVVLSKNFSTLSYPPPILISIFFPEEF